MLCGGTSRDIKLLLCPTIAKQSFGTRKDFFLKFRLTEVGEALYNKEEGFVNCHSRMVDPLAQGCTVAKTN